MIRNDFFLYTVCSSYEQATFFFFFLRVCRRVSGQVRAQVTQPGHRHNHLSSHHHSRGCLTGVPQNWEARQATLFLGSLSGSFKQFFQSDTETKPHRIHSRAQRRNIWQARRRRNKSVTKSHTAVPTTENHSGIKPQDGPRHRLSIPSPELTF